MIACPWCNRPAMTLLQKSALGPGRVVGCGSCGKKIAAHWAGVFAATPAFVGGYVLMKSGYAPIGFAAVAGGLLLMGVLQTFAIPLVRSDA